MRLILKKKFSCGNEYKTFLNSSNKSKLKNSIKNFKLFLNLNNDIELIKNEFCKVQRIIDKCVTKKIIHKNNASRKKSNLYKKINAKFLNNKM